ncbi:Hint domain-containing protein [Rhodobacter sp. NSM]|uniref:Hint domain-containing protein n=1 Tax=Rhodobacter sp. NSM TaxID=3457501 RepID=UPI003FD23BD9
MATVTIIPVGAVSMAHDDGTAVRNGNVLTNALNGDAFSWENPQNVVLDFDLSQTVTLHLDDADGVLTDDPVNGSIVVDQMLTEDVTIGSKSWDAVTNNVRWADPKPVFVEDEYHVTLYDAAGTAYTMVGISISTGYDSVVAGVAFLGTAPPAGTALTYVQGQSTYVGSGQSAPIASLTVSPAGVPCFLAGTLIATPDGERRVETIQPGDPVLTLGHGARPVRWAGASLVPAMGDLAPIRIRAGTLGNARDLWVSPNHRLLLADWRAQILFGEESVLVAAKHLVDDRRVTRVPMAQAAYHHLLLDRHEILLAEGARAESLHFGSETMRCLPPEALAEINAIFPGKPWRQLSHPEITRRESILLTSR